MVLQRSGQPPDTAHRENREEIFYGFGNLLLEFQWLGTCEAEDSEE